MLANLLPVSLWLFMYLKGVVSFRSDNAFSHNEHLDVDKLHHNSTAKGEPRCYCKEVEGPDACKDNKYPDQSDRMDGPRFYHSVGHEKPLCCKREDSGWVNSLFGIGWDYKSQPDMSLCSSETTAVPATGCCHVYVRGRPSMGIRVASAYAEFKEEKANYYSYADDDKVYKKSATTVKFSDITGAVDFNNAELSSEDVKAFLRRSFKVDPKNEILTCKEDIRSIAKGSDNSECLLRKDVPKACCCLSMTLETPPVRCLAVTGAPAEVPQELEIETEFKVFNTHGLQDTRFSKGQPQEPKTDSYFNKPDPERGDDFIWKWVRSSHQWSETCLEYRTVYQVKSYQESKRVSYGSTERYWNGKFWQDRHVTKYKTVQETKYRNQVTKVCALTKWTRSCPAGKVLFDRRIPKGQCFSSSAGLVAGPDFTYVCPADYTDGKQNGDCDCDACS